MMKKIENGALMKKITLKDIAAELNVTVGTVSHVLNGVGDISAVTRERVLETAKRMGYISNSGAVALRQGKTHTVAIIVPDISNPHIAWQIKLMEAKLKQHEYSVVILNTNEEEGEENGDKQDVDQRIHFLTPQSAAMIIAIQEAPKKAPEIRSVIQPQKVHSVR